MTYEQWREGTVRECMLWRALDPFLEGPDNLSSSPTWTRKDAFIVMDPDGVVGVFGRTSLWPDEALWEEKTGE